MPNYTEKLNLPIPLGNEIHNRAAQVNLIETIDENVGTQLDSVSDKIGPLSQLETENKNSIVEAINENVSQLADKAKYTVFTKSNNQTIPNAAVTNLLWEQMTPYNGADFCILEGNRIKFTQSGLYQIQLSLTWESNAPNNFVIFPTKNPRIGPQWLGGDNYSFLTAFAEYNAGEYLNDRVYQTSGSAKNIITNVRSMVEIRQVVRL